MVKGSTRTRSSDNRLFAFFFRETAVVFDDEVFGRVRADGVAAGLFGPLAGRIFLLAGLEAGGLQALLGAGKAAADVEALGVEPDLFAGRF